MPTEKLSPEEVERRMESLPEWTESGDALQRTLNFRDFKEAMAFVDRVAALAERLKHHPDILIRYNKVTLTLSTHDAGGITAKDFSLGKEIEAVMKASAR
jgi:4a-hydroxytetrahydrobiopterin dehydratase